MNSRNESGAGIETGTRSKKRGLGRGLEPLLPPGGFSGLSFAAKPTHPEWVRVSNAKEIFSHRIESFYKQRYPSSNVTVDDSCHENVSLHCDQALDICFRIQASGAGWSKDTLVISNIPCVFDTLIKDFFLELLNFLISIQSEVGFFYLGLENVTSCEVVDQQSPGSKLIRRFSFQKVEQHWTIPMVALKQRIEEEMASSNCPMDSSNEA